VIPPNAPEPRGRDVDQSNSVCYHAVRKAVAVGKCVTAHVSTQDIPADLCTKVMPGGRKRDHLVSLILYDIADHT
jgi:hypothetical protein